MGILVQGEHVSISPSCIIDHGDLGCITIGDRSKIKHYSILIAMENKISIGARVSIGEFSYIAAHGGVTIGDYSIIAPRCTISAAQHIYADLATPIRFQGEEALGIKIGSDVWIGANSVIMDGVTIGSGSIVGAGSVVTRDIPTMCLAYGVPARVVRVR